MWTWFIEFVVLAVFINRALYHVAALWPAAFGNTATLEWSHTTYTVAAIGTAATQLSAAVLHYVEVGDEQPQSNHSAALLLATLIVLVTSLLFFLGDGRDAVGSTDVPTELALSAQNVSTSMHVACNLVLLYIAIAACMCTRSRRRDFDTFTAGALLAFPSAVYTVAFAAHARYAADATACTAPTDSETAQDATAARDAADMPLLIAQAAAVLMPAALLVTQLVRENVFGLLPRQLPITDWFDGLSSNHTVRAITFSIDAGVYALTLTALGKTHLDLASNNYNEILQRPRWALAVYAIWVVSILALLLRSIIAALLEIATPDSDTTTTTGTPPPHDQAEQGRRTMEMMMKKPDENDNTSKKSA